MNKNKTYRIIAFFTALTIVVTVFMIGFINTYAADKDSIEREVSTRTSYISSISPSLSFSDTTALLKCKVIGIIGITTKIKVTGTLQKNVSGSWTSVSTQTQTKDSYIMTYSRSSASSGSGYSYRGKYVVTAYSGTAYEVYTVYSNIVTLS